MAGTAVGTLGLVPLVRVTTDIYGWRGAMLIMAAMTTHFFLAAIVMWPVNSQNCSSHEVIVESEKEVKVKITQENGNNGHIMKSNSNDNVNSYCKNGQHNRYVNFFKDKYDIKYSSCPSDINKRHASDSLTNNTKEESAKFINEKLTSECLLPPEGCSILNTQAQETKPEERKAFDFDIFKNTDFVAYCVALIFMNTAIATYWTFLPSIAMSHGTTALSAANLIAWGAISGMFCFLYYLRTFIIIL